MLSNLNMYGQYNSTDHKHFRMIDNYIYLYHTDTLILLPTYPESIQDTMGITYSENVPISSPAPTFSYSNSGPRSLQIELPLHRDLMTDINYESASEVFNLEDPKVELTDDYVDVLVKQLQSMALPKYSSSEKMVNPPLVAIRFGNSIFCKGVIQGQVTVTHSGPILSYTDLDVQKYAMLTVSFTITEVDPYDADSVALTGGYRGLSTTLERRIYNQ